jgi:hypothetical protein
MILLFCAGLIFFCLPYLTLAAEKSYAVLKYAAQPVGSLFMIIIYFIFGKPGDWTGKPPEKPPANIFKLNSSGQHSWWVELFGRILAWAVWILLALILLMILGTCLYFFFQWLFSKTDLAVGKAPSRHPFHLWMERLRVFLIECWRKIVGLCKVYREGYRGAAPIYGALQKWGRRSGMPRYLSETPAEYCLRLQRRFPRLKQEVALIVESFHHEVYGGITLTHRQLALTAAAWFSLRSPRHWLRRLKSWFFRHKEEADPFPK